jgi:ADP-ribose pyrophosphatase YjhB (NUDIX family)
MAPGKDVRGTTLLVEDGEVLIVKEGKSKNLWSLPGGRLGHTWDQDAPDGKGAPEAIISTAVRENHEELGLRTMNAERLYHCDHESHSNQHKVTLITTTDEPRIKDGELKAWKWWDGKEPIPQTDGCREILRRYREGVEASTSPPGGA